MLYLYLYSNINDPSELIKQYNSLVSYFLTQLILMDDLDTAEQILELQVFFQNLLNI